MSSRDKSRRDDKLLHETGRKAFKSIEGDITDKNMENKLNKNLDDEEILNELQISEDIRHSLDIFVIDDSDTEENINEGLDIISD